MRKNARQDQRPYKHVCFSVLFSFLLAPLQAASTSHQPINPDWGRTLLVTLGFMVIVLVYHTYKLRKFQFQLQREHDDLAQRLIERTENLRKINNQLYNEINQHKHTEELVLQTQEYLNSIINSMPSALIGVTREGVITHWNLAAADATNMPRREALGKNLFEIYPTLPITPEFIHETIDKGIPRIQENQRRGEGPTSSHYDIAIYPLASLQVTGAVIRIDDVTMRVRIESMMIQNEKMMSLGELAAGLAHEINNPLSAILHGIQNIYRRTSPELKKNHEVAEEIGIEVQQVKNYLEARDIYTFLDAIREAGERSAGIVSNMLEFSHSNSKSREMTDIPKLLDHSLELATNSLELETHEGIEKLEVIREYQSNLPPVPCSTAEIQQVILNLLRNSVQAMKDDEYGAPLTPTVTLRAYRRGSSVCFEIEDNGPGMPEAIRRHIFEPFFTTKEVGQGTGLGLSVTYFIITEHHDGTIEVESYPGRGTKFIITLPIINE